MNCTINNRAVHVNSSIISVNCSVYHASRSVSPMTFGLLEAVHNLISVSRIQHEKCASIQRHRGEQAMEIPLQCDTRWVCKLKAVSTFKNRFHAIVACVAYFAEHGKSQEKAQARGLLLQLRSSKMLYFVHFLEIKH